METSQFDYDLPTELIGQTPVEPRDASRLMIVRRSTGQIEHRVFRDISGYLRAGDLLVLNQTRVIRARLLGKKAVTGGKVEILLLSRRDECTWEALTRGKGLHPGVRLLFHPHAATSASETEACGIAADVIAETESGSRIVRFQRPVEPLLHEIGKVPLPPYIHLPLADSERYQTVYGRIEGSVAASTAGLHFTPELLVDLRRLGVEQAFVTLHIGLDTFRPVKEERIEDHQIHSEWAEVTAPVAQQVSQAYLEGRRVVAAGTTVVRSLESAAGGWDPAAEACPWRSVTAFSGPTGLYIYPGYHFRAVDALITNFHLPRSTLLMLVSAFAGRDLIFRAYREAICERYRFFSFGDAMLVL